MAGIKVTEYRCDGYGCGSRESFRAGPSTTREAHAAGWVSWLRNGKGVDLCPACDARLEMMMRGEQPALELDEPEPAPTTSYDVATTSQQPAPAGVPA